MRVDRPIWKKNDSAERDEAILFRLNRKNFSSWLEQLTKVWKKNNAVHLLLVTRRPAAFIFPELFQAALPNAAPGAAQVRFPRYLGEDGMHRWKKDYDNVSRIEQEYITYAQPRCMADILKNMDSEIANQLQGIEGYNERVSANDIVWMIERAEFVSTGHGGASIAMDVIAYLKIELGGHTHKDFTAFCKAESDARKRLLGRDPDPAVILAAILDSHWMISLKDMPSLRDKIRVIYELAAWPTAQVQAPIFSNYLTTLEAAEGTGGDSHGQLRAHVAMEAAKASLKTHLLGAEKCNEIIRAHQAKIDEGDSIIAMYTRQAKGKQGRNGSTYTGPHGSIDKMCFRCGSKGHMYRDCTVTRQAKCATCGEQHHTNAHELVQELKAKRAAKKPSGTKLPWNERNDVDGNLCSMDDMLEAYEGLLLDDLDDTDDVEAFTAMGGFNCG